MFTKVVLLAGRGPGKAGLSLLVVQHFADRFASWGICAFQGGRQRGRVAGAGRVGRGDGCSRRHGIIDGSTERLDPVVVPVRIGAACMRNRERRVRSSTDRRCAASTCLAASFLFGAFNDFAGLVAHTGGDQRKERERERERKRDKKRKGRKRLVSKPS